MSRRRRGGARQAWRRRGERELGRRSGGEAEMVMVGKREVQDREDGLGSRRREIILF
jgi:hypothetical protein